MKLGSLQGRRRPEVQMAPLIDVVFLLLIFYAVTTQFVTDERLKLKLPEAKTAEDAGRGAEDRPPVVVVAKDGTVWIDDELVAEEDLEGRIRTLVDRAPVQAIILKGDRDADYGVVVHVLDIARSVGAKMVQMSAERPPAE
jgi:biopolymer transport protein ExbD